jgi:2-polyprenyl-6-methoxyphenol hydroxylase-like FAD-dependent oxidoreductase
MHRVGEHAVVIGASMAGLLAARALSEAYEQVTVVERDRLPQIGEGRRAVPQGRHGHALHPGGQRVLEELFGGFVDEITAAGAPRYRVIDEMRLSPGGHRIAPVEVGLEGIVASRPFLEGHVLRRVRGLANVRIVERSDALGLTTADDGRRVTGVRTLGRSEGSAEEVVGADLVVAATGRGARFPAWLEALGYRRPDEERLEIDMTYVSLPLRLRPGALDGEKVILVGARPGRPRGLALFAQEHGRRLLTLSGYAGNHPPTDLGAMLEFAATVAPPDVMAAIRDAEPAGEIDTHRFPANLRRRYERLRRFPDRLLVTGDAVCSFNPIYGQGMTVAALEADALRRCLASGGRRLGRRFFREAGKIVDHAWKMAMGADLALPEVEGPRPRSVRAINAYMGRLQRVAEHDPVVAEAFIRTIGMLEPPTHLMRPSVALRVVRGARAATSS